MVQVIAVHMEGGYRHDHISEVRWRNNDTKAEGTSTRFQMVEWIDGGGEAYVNDGTNSAWVGVVNAKPRYIRTYADGKWTDNLLALPRF